MYIKFVIKQFLLSFVLAASLSTVTPACVMPASIIFRICPIVIPVLYKVGLAQRALTV